MACYRERPLWDNTQVLNRIIKGEALPQLHSEIERFHELISPTPEEQQERNSAVSRFRRVAELLWPSCKVHIYGSFATGLYIPSSDIDLVILYTGWLDTQACLQALAAHLKNLNFAFYVKVLSTARVPIIKFEERESGLSFDVRVVDRSVDLTELHAVEMIKQQITKNPVVSPLYMVLKTYLQQEKLNEVFHSGGIASYMLFVMLTTYLQAAFIGFEALAQAQTMKIARTSRMSNYGPPDDSHNVSFYTLSSNHGARAPKTTEMLRPGQLAYTESYTYLGLLLIGFFHFYGICFNSELYGISCRDGGFFFIKEHDGFSNHSRPFLLAVEDPLIPSIDIGKNSFNYQGIRAAFARTYKALTSSYPTSNLLYCIIPLAKKWETRGWRQRGTPNSSKVHDTNKPGRDFVAFMSRQIETILESILQGDQDGQLPLLKFVDDLGEKQGGDEKEGAQGGEGAAAMTWRWRAADVLLWRKKHLSVGFLVGATVVWFLFEWIGYHFISVISFLLLGFVVVLFAWSNGAAFLNRAPPPVPKFQLSDRQVHDITKNVSVQVNKALVNLHEIVIGKDVKRFLKLVGVLSFLVVFGSWFHFLTLVYLAVVAAHTLPMLYEKHGDSIDQFADSTWKEMNNQYRKFDATILSKIPRKQPTFQRKTN